MAAPISEKLEICAIGTAGEWREPRAWQPSTVRFSRGPAEAGSVHLELGPPGSSACTGPAGSPGPSCNLTLLSRVMAFRRLPAWSSQKVRVGV